MIAPIGTYTSGTGTYSTPTITMSDWASGALHTKQLELDFRTEEEITQEESLWEE